MSAEFGPPIDPSMAATSEEFYGFGDEAEPEMEASSEESEEVEVEEPDDVGDQAISEEEAPEEEPQLAAESGEQEVEPSGSPAERRIQGLIKDRNLLQEQLAKQTSMFEEMNRTMQAQQRASYDAQHQRQQRLSADDQAKADNARLASLKAQGFDETDLSHQLAYQALRRVEEMSQQQAQQQAHQQQSLSQVQQQNYEQRYMVELDKSISGQLDGSQASSEQIQQLKHYALEQANLYRLGPADAAKRAFSQLQSMGMQFGKAPGKKKAPPEEGIQVQRAVAKRAQTAGRKKGSSSRKKGAVSDPEAALFGIPDGMW